MTTQTQDDPGANEQERHGGSIRSRIENTVDWVIKRKWPISVIVLYAATVTLPAMGRFLIWDEAVFWSQSGGLDGVDVEPLKLVASRELGSSSLIRLLRLVENDLAEVRYLWATLTFLLLVFGARRLISHLGDRGALIFIWVYGTHWLVLAWTPALYSNVLAACFAILAATYYLDLLSRNDSGLRYAVLFGVFMAATFAMRPVEAMLVTIGFTIHFFLFNARKVRALVGKAAVSVTVALAVFGLPWLIDSINRFGSIGNRIQAGFSQGGQVASGLRSNLVEYLGVLSGDRVANLSGGPVTYWPRFVVLAFVVVAVVVIAIFLIRRGLEALRGPPGLFVILSVTNASFFLFWREALSERYFFITMIFAAALFGLALATIMSPKPGWVAGAVFILVSIIWIVAQVATVTSYESIRVASSERSARVAATMRTLANDMPCEIRSRYGTPQLQVASGCHATLYTDWADAVEFAERESEGPQFIYGPDREGHFEGLPRDWVVIPVGNLSLAYWIPDHEGGSE